MLTRVSPNATLADIFKLVVTEKNLDPYKCEMRHPTSPDTPLNMASPLREYALTEIDVVAVTGEWGKLLKGVGKVWKGGRESWEKG